MPFDRIPKGSLILVTGATGFVGSAVCDAAIVRGFKVRGVTRFLSKAAALVEYLDSKHGRGSIEFVEVKDITASDAFEGVLEGVAGILHLATDYNFSTIYETVVGGVVQSTLVLMKAAAKVPSVKSFVLTSSRIAIFHPSYGQPEISPKLNEWNDDFVMMAKQESEDGYPQKSLLVYAASKVKGEQAAFDYYNSTRPSYVFNTVIPDISFGPVFNPTPGYYSSHSLLNELFRCEPEPYIVLNLLNPASLAVDVRDVASLHLAVLLSTQTDGKRLWAAAHPFEINDLLRIWREEFPDRTFVEDFKFPPQPKITLELTQSEKLLEEFEGRTWLPFRDCVIANVQDALYSAQPTSKFWKERWF
ncbi:Epimerase domain-containing protein [Mycena sanguinolenta]|uniref:Epimerase domain-containing protein n=1 Tax=Mycena sanguinolenta TaxID=230812 RepID=A0A8H6ZHQ2_9AGAR|nr:Epimerase domain-containing protein [Mycena sanguinolenta]